MPKTVLVTTNWPSHRDVVLERREKELKGEYWNTLIDQGLNVRQFQRNPSSAWAIIDPLLNDIKHLKLPIDEAGTYKERKWLYSVQQEDLDPKMCPKFTRPF